MEAAAKHLTPVTLELGGTESCLSYFFSNQKKFPYLQANLPSSSTLNAISRRLVNGCSGAKLQMQVKLALRPTMFSSLEISKMN
jgi:hypothetical protein